MSVEAAAAFWGGRDLRLLGHRENAVYAMTCADGTRAALRLHRAGYQSADAIRSELWWCAALADAGVAVPRPLPCLSGDLLASYVPGQHASAISWVEGAALGEARVPLTGNAAAQAAVHHALGRLLAQMHDATDALALPPGFQRPRWDRAGLLGEAPFWGRFWEHPLLTPPEAEVLYAARDLLRGRLADLPEAGPGFGLIHADVLRENVFVDSGALTLIDFDDCGFGYRLYDLGTVLSQNLYEPHFPAIRDSLIAGYASLRAVDAEQVTLFTLMRTLASVGWVAPRLPLADPVHRKHIDRALMCAGQVLG
ncbi:phosphotransferase [Fertoebacter nigrum]|uniref:Phosphotransferase n=1 Tax=Fertoeibacter niger TaxID=2656921 RepID=A0A8X8H0I0_9RHOB|nr:phosphotransferase [Fertoeibacter niger]NUB44861.1 phosphotransferase [Fertoeibacter niger]